MLLARQGLELKFIPLTLFGVPGTLTSPLREGLSLACVDNLEGTREPGRRQSLTDRLPGNIPPLPSRFIACPPKALSAMESGAGEGVDDCRDPTLRI